MLNLTPQRDVRMQWMFNFFWRILDSIFLETSHYQRQEIVDTWPHQSGARSIPHKTKASIHQRLLQWGSRATYGISTACTSILRPVWPITESSLGLTVQDNWSNSWYISKTFSNVRVDLDWSMGGTLVACCCCHKVCTHCWCILKVVSHLYFLRKHLVWCRLKWCRDVLRSSQWCTGLLAYLYCTCPYSVSTCLGLMPAIMKRM